MKFNENGLVVAIAQDSQTGEVLMQAYMNEESYNLTLDTGFMHYYSRSRKSLWKKGETSGHFQKVVSCHEDCDGDSLLFKVIQSGVACHTGNRTCFYNEVINTNLPDSRIIFDVYRTILDRKECPVEGSYTNYLFTKGLDKILKKIGEEASESIIAAKNKDKKELTMELSDLLYHALVLMANEGVTPSDIFEELMAREGKKPLEKYRLTK